MLIVTNVATPKVGRVWTCPLIVVLLCESTEALSRMGTPISCSAVFSAKCQSGDWRSRKGIFEKNVWGRIAHHLRCSWKEMAVRYDDVTGGESRTKI